MQSLWMLLAALLFAIMGACIKLVSTHLSTHEIIFFRGLLGVVFVPFIVRWRGGSLATTCPKLHLKRSLAGMAAMWLAFFAISQLPLATASTLTNTAPIWMAIILTSLAYFQQKSRPHPGFLLSIGSSFLGVIVLLRPTLHAGQGLGASLALLSGWLTAIAYLQVGALARQGEPDTRIVFYFSLFVTGISAITCCITGWVMPHAHEWLILGIMSLSATLAQICMTRSYSRGKTLLSANLQYSGIVFSSLLGLVIWQEHLTSLAWLGMIIIIASNISATWLNYQQRPSLPARPTTLNDAI